MNTGRIVALSCLTACGGEVASPCADGFGRDQAGDCVAVGSADAQPPSPTAPDVEDTGEAVDTDPPEEERPTWTPPDAVWSAEEVAQAFEELLALGVPDPFTVFDGYRTMFDGADPGCPGGGPYEITSTASGCVSDSGWLYAGMASIHDFEHDIEEATVLNVDGYVISPSGSTFYGGGTVAANLIRDVDADAWLVQMIGTFGLDTSEAEWFAMMPSLALTGSGGMMEADRQADLPVSYTHLTLPTICSV